MTKKNKAHIAVSSDKFERVVQTLALTSQVGDKTLTTNVVDGILTKHGFEGRLDEAVALLAEVNVEVLSN